MVDNIPFNLKPPEGFCGITHSFPCGFPSFSVGTLETQSTLSFCLSLCQAENASCLLAGQKCKQSPLLGVGWGGSQVALCTGAGGLL